MINFIYFIGGAFLGAFFEEIVSGWFDKDHLREIIKDLNKENKIIRKEIKNMNINPIKKDWKKKYEHSF